MAHFAQIKDNFVTQVIVVGNADCEGGDFPKSEEVGQKFISSIGLDGEWLQTSYSGSFRGRYAGIGFTYNSNLDMFISPQPHPSWVLDKNGEWKAPIDMPDDGKMYDWNEEVQQWVEIDFPS